MKAKSDYALNQISKQNRIVNRNPKLLPIFHLVCLYSFLLLHNYPIFCVLLHKIPIEYIEFCGFNVPESSKLMNIWNGL